MVKTIIKPYENIISDLKKKLKMKMLIDFDHSVTCSIKSLAVQKNTEVKTTSLLFNGRKLIFVKISLMSFFYDIIAAFACPNKAVKEVYSQNKILTCFPYDILIDSYSTAVIFVL